MGELLFGTPSASDRATPLSGAGWERLLVRSTRSVRPGCSSRGWCTALLTASQLLLGGSRRSRTGQAVGGADRLSDVHPLSLRHRRALCPRRAVARAGTLPPGTTACCRSRAETQVSRAGGSAGRTILVGCS